MEKSINNNRLSDYYQISAVLHRCDQNVSQAARDLGMSKSTLYRLKKDSKFMEIHNMVHDKESLSYMENESELLKGMMMNIALGNMGDYFDKNNQFVGFANLTPEQTARIKKFSIKNTEYGEIIGLELYDAMKANMCLAGQHGIYNQIKFDLSLLDLVELEDIEYLTKKYGWDDL